MTVAQLFHFLEERIPFALSAEWDNDGLACCPEADRPVRRVLIALDATEAVVDRALAGGFDLLLTHHPLLFKGVKELTVEDPLPRKLIKLIRGGVSAMSFHTRLDAVEGGVNDLLAHALGLCDPVPFGPEGEIPCGRIGHLPTPVSAKAFADTVCRALGVPSVLLAGQGEVRSVAVLGGEGGDFVQAARAAGADLFLSGRIGYHRMLDAAETGLCLIEAGHFATENPICGRLGQLLREADPTLEIEQFSACGIARHALGKD